MAASFSDQSFSAAFSGVGIGGVGDVINIETDTTLLGSTTFHKAVKMKVGAAANIAQFLDRDTSPEFASNVAGQAFADFISDPTSIDSILDDMQAQAQVYRESSPAS